VGEIAVTTRETFGDRLSLVQTFLQHYTEGHVDDAVRLLAPTVEYTVPGVRGPASRFVGPEAVANRLEKLLRVTERPIDVLKWEDWLVGDTYIVAVVRFELQRPGRVQVFRVVLLFRVSSNMLIEEVECFYSDPEAFDRFFAW
jgi:ketosteroid isomerase-like protein